MSSFDETALTALLAAIAATAAAGLFLAWTYPRLRRRLSRIAPASRSRVLLGLMAAPLACGTAVGILNLTPLLDYGAVVHHCHYHSVADCEPHAAAALAGGVGKALVVFLALSAIVPMLRLALTVRRLRRTAKGLLACSRRDRVRGIHILEDSRPAAFSFGMLAPRIFLTTSLADALGGAELDIVLGHERAHARRRDTLRALAGRILSLGHLPATGRDLAADLHLAAEQACDEAAGAVTGDRLDVASVLLKVERLHGAPAIPLPAGAQAFTGSSVPARVEALMAPPEARRPAAPQSAAILTALAAAVFLAAEPLHHMIEDLIHLLIG